MYSNSLKYMKQKLTEIQGEIDKSTTPGRVFNSSLSEINKAAKKNQ